MKNIIHREQSEKPKKKASPTTACEVGTGENHVKLDIKKEDGEYVVRWIENGQRIEAKCYYTDDLEDARQTQLAMLKELLNKKSTLIKAIPLKQVKADMKEIRKISKIIDKDPTLTALKKALEFLDNPKAFGCKIELPMNMKPIFELRLLLQMAINKTISEDMGYKSPPQG